MHSGRRSSVPRMLRLTAVAMAVLALTLGPTSLVGHAAGSNPAGPGCHPEWPVVTHHAGGQVVTGAAGLIACANETGYYTGETGIGVTDNGTIWVQAADWEWALARSTDDGATWVDYTVRGPQAWPGCEIGTSAFATPQCSDTESAKTNTVADGFVWVDPATSRVLWSKTYGFATCSSLNVQTDPDPRKDWHPVTQFACPGGDYEKIGGGPPPPAANCAPSACAQPTGGYPNILYGCANGYAPWFVAGPGRFCWKSLDGGLTWAQTGDGAPVVPSPQAPGCLHFQEPQKVGPDGTLYVPLNCAATGTNPAGLVRVALSHDEGRTWSYVAVPTGSVGSAAGLIGGVSLDVDQAGNLYVVWPGADNLPYLAVSKDQGLTWNGPLMIGMPAHSPDPAVTEASPRAQVSARGPGHIAVSYYGYPTGSPSTTLNGYLTESFNAADAQPLFYSARVNDTAHPLYFPVKSGALPRNDYLGVTIAPDGTPWTALVKLLSDTPDSQGYIQSTGYVARLVPVQPNAAVPEAAVTGALPLVAMLALGAALPVALRRRRASRASGAVGSGWE
jgi:hypothetical protein